MPNWIIAIVVAAIVAGLGVAAYNWRENDKTHWKNVGRAELTAEIAQATKEAEDATKTKQSEIKKKTVKVKDEIKRNLDGDRPVSPVLARELERLRRDRKD